MRIKFISLNLYEGGLLFDNVLKFLEKENPDIVAFQEVMDGTDPSFDRNIRTIETLKAFLKDWHYHFAPEFLCIREIGKVEIGNAIFSRFPITNTTTSDFGIPYGEYDECPIGKDFSKHPKNIHCCEIDIKGKNYTVCNLHGIWGLDGVDNPERLKMSRIIVDQVKDKPRVLLTGDFNLKPNTQTIKNIENHLSNLFKDELDTSFNLSRKDLERFPGYATAVVDMMFASKDVKVVSHYCPQVDVSDHLPLVCQFEVN